MPLFDIVKNMKLVKPKQCENNEILVKAKKTLHAKTFQKMIETMDQALENLKPSSSSALVWTKTGALIGHGSKESVKDINHLWQSAYKAFHNGTTKLSQTQMLDLDETVLKFMGSLLRWRISLLPDNWLLFRKETDRVNRHGKDILESNYWINN